MNEDLPHHIGMAFLFTAGVGGILAMVLSVIDPVASLYFGWLSLACGVIGLLPLALMVSGVIE